MLDEGTFIVNDGRSYYYDKVADVFRQKHTQVLTPRITPWQKMVPSAPDPESLEKVVLTLPEELREQAREQLAAEEMWVNDLYTASVRYQESNDPNGEPIVHLSIRRNDRTALHDWRDFQQIKNDVLGDECEAIELYPAESRLVDEANQFHLWGFKSLDRFQVGFGQRVVGEGSNGLSAQRAFIPEDRPADCIDVGDPNSIVSAHLEPQS